MCEFAHDRYGGLIGHIRFARVDFLATTMSAMVRTPAISMFAGMSDCEIGQQTAAHYRGMRSSTHWDS